MARMITNGKARTLGCPTHRSVQITVYGAPGTDAWCFCGKAMKARRKSSTSKSNA